MFVFIYIYLFIIILELFSFSFSQNVQMLRSMDIEIPRHDQEVYRHCFSERVRTS